MGVKWNSKTFTKYVFNFLKPFRPILALKLAKSANKSTIKNCLAKIPYGYHKTQISTSLNPSKNCKKIHPKEVICRKLLHIVIKVKKSIFCVTFSLIPFLAWVCLQLFQRIRNQHQIQDILKPILHFWKIWFFFLLPLFANFEVKHGPNSSQKTKKVFCKCVVKIKFCNHQRVTITKLLKSLYPSAH